MNHAHRETTTRMTCWQSAWRSVALLMVMLAVGAVERPVLVKADAQALSSVQSGGRAIVAVNLHIEPGWHLYWTNPGDSGLPPRLTWTLPVGWSAAAPRFPVPEREDDSGLVSFIYRHDVRLLVEVSAPADATPGEHPLVVQIDYLACKESCMPGKTAATVLVPVVAQAAPSPVMDLGRFAVSLAASGVSVVVHSSAGAVEIDVRGTDLPEPSAFPFIPAEEGRFQLTAKQVVSASSAAWRLRIPLTNGQAMPDTVRGMLVGLPGVSGVMFDVPLMSESAVKTPRNTIVTGAPVIDTTLIGALAVGLIGGLLLNLMPCVLPVLALKSASVTRRKT